MILNLLGTRFREDQYCSKSRFPAFYAYSLKLKIFIIHDGSIMSRQPPNNLGHNSNYAVSKKPRLQCQHSLVILNNSRDRERERERERETERDRERETEAACIY